MLDDQKKLVDAEEGGEVKEDEEQKVEPEATETEKKVEVEDGEEGEDGEIVDKTAKPIIKPFKKISRSVNFPLSDR